MTYAVKVKMPGAKVWHFLGMKGSITRLRVHAVQIADRSRADAYVADIVASNPGVTAKVVPFWKGAVA